MTKPMTPERLADIRYIVTNGGYSEPFTIRELLAEIDRLRAVVSAYEQAEKRERERGELFGQ